MKFLQLIWIERDTTEAENVDMRDVRRRRRRAAKHPLAAFHKVEVRQFVPFEGA